jgi:hypothetical protein
MHRRSPVIEQTAQRFDNIKVLVGDILLLSDIAG